MPESVGPQMLTSAGGNICVQQQAAAAGGGGGGGGGGKPAAATSHLQSDPPVAACHDARLVCELHRPAPPFTWVGSRGAETSGLTTAEECLKADLQVRKAIGGCSITLLSPPPLPLPPLCRASSERLMFSIASTGKALLQLGGVRYVLVHTWKESERQEQSNEATSLLRSQQHGSSSGRHQQSPCTPAGLHWSCRRASCHRAGTSGAQRRCLLLLRRVCCARCVGRREACIVKGVDGSCGGSIMAGQVLEEVL